MAAAAPPQDRPLLTRVEPPFWWVGMRWSRVELMLHGRDLAGFAPATADPEVRVEGPLPCQNPNYLFLVLSIGAAARPGQVEISLTRGAEQLLLRYELRAREDHAGPRVGISAADVILNLVPDRFARGRPGQGDLDGFADRVDRANIGCGRHGGDLQGIADHLDYFAHMGYTALWPTPLTESNQDRYSYHGYAATDTYRIDPRFGSNEEYRQLVQQARARGIGMIQDIVLNHIGSQHWWMADLPAPDWVTHGGRYTATNHAHTTVNDPYAAHADRECYIGGWFDECMPDMNHRNPRVAAYQIQNTIWWVEYAGLAGVRADTYGYSDQDFLAAWSGHVTAEYPGLSIVGETWSFNPVTVAYWLRGKENRNGYVSHLPAVMDYPLSGLLREALPAPDALHSGLFRLYEGLTNDVLYPDPMQLIVFEGNHDLPRLFSVLGEDIALFRMAIAYVLTMRGIPQLYYGTEILMTSPLERDDGAFRQDFPGGWPGDPVQARSGVGLSAAQREAQAFVRTLLQWRRRQPVIHSGKLLHFAPDYGSYVYFRYDSRQLVMVVLNKNHTEHVLDLARFGEILPAGASGVDVISGQRHALHRTLAVPARSALILEVTPARPAREPG